MAQVTGGEKMEAALKMISGKLSKNKVRVGFLEGATYPDGTSVPAVAAIQEFGAPRARIPPRMGFRTMVADKKSEWPKAVALNLKDTGYDVKITLARMGEGIKGQLQEQIAKVSSPPLRPVTLMLRKMRHDDPDLVVTGKTVGEAARRVAAGESWAGVSEKPLVWSGHLMNSVDYEVVT